MKNGRTKNRVLLVTTDFTVRARRTNMYQQMKPKGPNQMKPKLLLVDDDDSVRDSLTKLLAKENLDVLPARDAAEALELFRSNAVSLIVLDVNLRPDGGWKVFERMTEINPFVPTVIITAEFDQRDRAVRAGVEALIEKPIDVPIFLKTIRDLLTETSEQHLERVCGDDAYCRYVARKYATLLHLHEERHSAPLELSLSLQAVLSKEPEFSAATDLDKDLTHAS
jgi:DNA-binding NtrC family response regulator